MDHKRFNDFKFLGSRLSSAELHDLLENFESIDTKDFIFLY